MFFFRRYDYLLERRRVNLELEFIEVFSYLRIYLSNSESVYRSLVQSSEYTSQQMKNEILSKYTLFGSDYVYNGASTIDWGTFINAIISFLIVALTLFIILKVYNTLQQKRKDAQEKLLEEYYKRNPEARPKLVVEEVPLPKPTELDVLLEIKDLLKDKEKKDDTKKAE